MSVPAHPKIYHIVHVDRLRSILDAGRLWSDREMADRTSVGTTIGMGKIKQNRLAYPVKCWPGDVVGEYVPFYFCSRSIMLFVLHCANNPDLAYRGGQGPIVHLEADLRSVIAEADANSVRWAIALSNAGSRYAEFRRDVGGLEEIDWNAVANRDFRDPDVKERKQAEFLVKRSFPWPLVERIGVASSQVAQQVADVMAGAAHRPTVEIRRDWYF